MEGRFAAQDEGRGRRTAEQRLVEGEADGIERKRGKLVEISDYIPVAAMSCDFRVYWIVCHNLHGKVISLGKEGGQAGQSSRALRKGICRSHATEQRRCAEDAGEGGEANMGGRRWLVRKFAVECRERGRDKKARMALRRGFQDAGRLPRTRTDSIKAEVFFDHVW
jgi:hypothetical protein